MLASIRLSRHLCHAGICMMTFGLWGASPAPGQDAKPAEPAVKALNNAVLAKLPFAERADFEDAARGFIATVPDARVTGPGGNVV